MSVIRTVRTWLKEQVDKLLLLPAYFRALAKEWLNILFGETLVGIVFLVWWSLGAPTNHALIVVFVSAMFVAGYYAWRADHLRLKATIEITRVVPREWMHTHDATVSAGQPAKSYYLEVVNRSAAFTIEGVSVQLSRIEPDAPNWDFLPISLHLQHDNPKNPEDQVRSFSLNPGEPRNIDFVSALEGDNRFSVVHVVAWVNNQIPFDTEGNRLQVRITAKDMPSLLRWFKVWRDNSGFLQCQIEE